LSHNTNAAAQIMGCCGSRAWALFGVRWSRRRPSRVVSWGLLPWCHLHLPGVIHVVVVGVIETSLVFLKLKEKNKSQWLVSSSVPHVHVVPLVAITALVAAVVPVVAAPHKPIAWWFLFLSHTSLFVYNR
jgi:hypothetical protein